MKQIHSICRIVHDAEFKPEEHPRVPEGSSKGGEFTFKGGGVTGSVKIETIKAAKTKAKVENEKIASQIPKKEGGSAFITQVKQWRERYGDKIRRIVSEAKLSSSTSPIPDELLDTSKFSKDTLKAFAFYEDKFYFIMNSIIRNPDKFYPEDVEKINKYVGDMKKGFIELKHGVTVYRGVSDLKALLPNYGQDKNIEGTVIIDKAFSSTSRDFNIARSFSIGGVGTSIPAIFNIFVPKGTRAAKGMEAIEEIILDTQQHYLIIHHSESNGIVKINAIALPEKDIPKLISSKRVIANKKAKDKNPLGKERFSWPSEGVVVITSNNDIYIDGRLIEKTHDAEFKPEEHPRVGAGSSKGGEFTFKGGGVAGSVKVETEPFKITAKPISVKEPSKTKAIIDPNKPYESAAPAQLSWEAAPGMTTKHFFEYHNAPLVERKEYLKAISSILNDWSGADIIAGRLGLKPGKTFPAPGAFQGRVNPGAQGQAALDIRKLDPDTRARLDVSEAVRGLLLRQDAAAWHKPQFLPQDQQAPYLIPALRVKNPEFSKYYIAREDVIEPAIGESLTERKLQMAQELQNTIMSSFGIRKEDRQNTHIQALMSMPEKIRKDFIAQRKHDDPDNFYFLNDQGKYLNRTAARTYAEQNDLLTPLGKRWQQSELIAEHLKPEATRPQDRLRPQDINLMDFRIGRPVNEDEVLAVTGALNQGMGSDFFAPIATPQGFRLLNVPNITGVDNAEFTFKVSKALEALQSSTLPSELHAHVGHAESNYIDNDWSVNPHGEGYLARINAGRSDLSRTAQDIIASLGPQIEAVEEDFAQRYGWTPDRENRPWRVRQAQQRVKGAYDRRQVGALRVMVSYRQVHVRHG